MSFDITAYLGTLARALNSIDNYRGATSTVTAASNVSESNRHRPLLDSIRTDLYHFDEEKRARIIYTITNYLATNSPDDTDLIEVLQRVLQVVQQYKATGQVLVSPTKAPNLSPGRVSLPNTAMRKLIFDLDAFEDKK